MGRWLTTKDTKNTKGARGAPDSRQPVCGIGRARSAPWCSWCPWWFEHRFAAG